MTRTHQDDPLPDIIPVAQALEILNMSKSSAIRLARSGQIKAKLLGKQWAFSKASVEAYKAQREKSGKK